MALEHCAKDKYWVVNHQSNHQNTEVWLGQAWLYLSRLEQELRELVDAMLFLYPTDNSIAEKEPSFCSSNVARLTFLFPQITLQPLAAPEILEAGGVGTLKAFDWATLLLFH